METPETDKSTPDELPRQPSTLLKKLTQGQFAFDDQGALKQTLSYAQLQWLIDGIEVKQVAYRKRFTYPVAEVD